MRMTIDELLERVAELKGWRLEDCAGIGVLCLTHADGRVRDPLTAVCELVTGEFFPDDQWSAPAERLGLLPTDAAAIVAAADGGYGPEYDELRALLLGAVGVGGDGRRSAPTTACTA